MKSPDLSHPPLARAPRGGTGKNLGSRPSRSKKTEARPAENPPSERLERSAPPTAMVFGRFRTHARHVLRAAASIVRSFQIVDDRSDRGLEQDPFPIFIPVC